MRRMMLNPIKNFTLFILLAFFSFGISYSLLDAYSLGDQVHYHNFYELINGVSFIDVGPIALSAIGSAEPLSWLVLWIGSNLGVDKNTWISILNVMLIIGLVALFKKHQAPWWTILLILTNFYIIVLMTGAERLKIAYVVLILASLSSSRWQPFFVALSPLAHLQSFILLVSVFFARLADPIKRLFSSGFFSLRVLYRAVLFLILLITGYIYFQDGIVRKGLSYARVNVDFSELSQILVLFLVGWFSAKNKFQLTLLLLPLIPSVIILGGQRVNMIAATAVIGLLMVERRLSQPLVVMLLIYLSLKSIPFVSNIYKHGNGFGGPLW